MVPCMPASIAASTVVDDSWYVKRLSWEQLSGAVMNSGPFRYLRYLCTILYTVATR